MDDGEILMCIVIAGLALLVGVVVASALNDDFPYDFCKWQGHEGLERSNAEMPNPYIMCYDTPHKEDRTFTKYVLTAWKQGGHYDN